MSEDWRITNQMKYLYGVSLKRADFKAVGNRDHEHCEFCFDKFGEQEGMLRSGYCTLDEYRWICGRCFQDFRDMFRWKVE